ncbi:PilZ domain-containing protein [Sphingomonas sp. KR1UV-12]|uniref:PilZ domain-containing protein n=1 Tax=Sphingomonas aurea TaxID=3063994 RepID=A0ABT9EN58_9SPHN|nr:PilZ domain-containing protein [Sphingomonas sp. KR1UV-12]MDP1028228.1 PilZ domain-containing protein [Sphingomonas sp. KR1UV-12]
MSDAINQDRAKRSGVIIRADVLIGERRMERRVRNLSTTGACLDHDGEMVKGARIQLAMGRLHDLDAEVMWVTDKLAGIRFDEPIDTDEARVPRGAGKAQTGWMTDINNAYRKAR